MAKMLSKIVSASLVGLISQFVLAAPIALPPDGRVDIWPTIPFMRGADLCAYKDALSQTKTEYMSQMIGFASQLMEKGASGSTALQMLVQFNKMHELNVKKATHYLDITLEASMRAYLDQFYRDLNPTIKRISFTHVEDIRTIVNLVIKNQRNGVLTDEMLARLDYVAYATYSLAPNCEGEVQVTLHLVGKDGKTTSYIAIGPPSTVMSKIAAQMFEDFQRTQFPSVVQIGDKSLTIVGGVNGTVGLAPSIQVADMACKKMSARLPTEEELEYINMVGDWSGGVFLGDRDYWAMERMQIFAPSMRPYPVREPKDLNYRAIRYYCVK